METRIKNYEKFVKESAKYSTSELKKYHAEMVRNFQHERAIHLAVTLFFVGLTLVFGGLATLAFAAVANPFNLGNPGTLLAIIVAILAVLLFIISAFYIKHYYFLENHIQKLYDITTMLYK